VTAPVHGVSPLARFARACGPIEAGRIIAGKYELVRRLGHGSMGEVWVAHHRTLGEDIALKLLDRAPPHGDTEDTSTATARFRFEAQVAARLSRKTRHIVEVSDHGEEEGLAYLVMELLEGQTLEARIMRRGCLTLAEASKLVAQIARALTAAHSAGVAHRDLKPANVFLTLDEDGALLVKLLDFGIARTIHTHRVAPTFETAQGLVFGTPGYMSPEQASPSFRVDCRCDLWALATVAYEALTGELPVAGASTQELLANLCAGHIVPVHERDPGLPASLSAFFQRSFAPAIRERFQSASELALDFEQAVGLGVGTEVVPTKHRAQAWLGLAVLAAMLLTLTAVEAARTLVESSARHATTVPAPSTFEAAGLGDTPIWPGPAAATEQPTSTSAPPVQSAASALATPIRTFPTLPVLSSAPQAPSPPAPPPTVQKPIDKSAVL
jgi:hypothetical protein